MTLTGLSVPVATVVAGLGGRSITKSSLSGVFEAALRGELGRLTFLDLNQGLVERELERMALHRRSGPTAENMLRDLGVAASRIG
jgi:pyruvate ferredoxin oxidoreductase alpha subunit